MSKTDDLSAWRVFVTVARSGTLSAAAKALDVEVSSISRAIGGLEKALGCELIRRNMRPMKLTEAGQAALKRMETILRAHDGLMEALVNDNRALTRQTRSPRQTPIPTARAANASTAATPCGLISTSTADKPPTVTAPVNGRFR